MHKAAITALIVLVLSLNIVHADLMTFTYVGFVESCSLPGTSFCWEDVGSTMTVQYTFNSEAEDIRPEPTWGYYWNAITSVSIRLSNYSATGTETYINVYNDEYYDGYGNFDSYSFSLGDSYSTITGASIGDFELSRFTFTMYDFTTTAFDSDALPLTPPNPTNFISDNHTYMKLSFRDPSFEAGWITAKFPVCGNGILELGEECDDGNTYNGDCCSETCTLPTGAWKGVDIGNNFCLGNNCCDAKTKPTGEYPLGHITDGANNRFELTCHILNVNSVRLELKYISSDGFCSEIVGQCKYPGGFNRWGLYESNDSINNCFIWSYWITQNDEYNPTDWKPTFFDTINCKEIGGPPPLQSQHLQVSSESSPIGLITRWFTSPDGPGGHFGDLLLDIQYNERLEPLDLPIGNLGIGILIPCDNDNDGDCDSDDFVLVNNAIGTCEGDSDYNEPADADHDGCVLKNDVNIIFPNCVGDYDIDENIDGHDIAVFITGGEEISLNDFAGNFGQTNCTEKE